MNNRSTRGLEAVESKRNFEREALLSGVTIKKYRSDNGIFVSQEFTNSLTKMSQTIDRCGIGAHHQNGIDERHIKTIVERTRTMLLHAIHRWPSTIMTEIWPLALKLAVDLQNTTPGHTDHSPTEIFTGTKAKLHLMDFHTLGCMVYILEPTLQNGLSLPK
jgi:hypothetical protein